MILSTISATTARSTVLEGSMAKTQFSISPSLAENTTVALSIDGYGATAGEDFSGLMYSTDGINFVPVVDGTGVLPAGASNLWLQVQLLKDTVIEYSEAVSFVVEQLSSNSALENSWWVNSVVDIKEASPLPAPPSTLIAVSTTSSVIEGGYAISKFVLDKAQPTATNINVGVEGWSATIGQDTAGALQYQIGTGAWADVVGGVVSIKAGATQMNLRIKTINDLKTESNESISFYCKSASDNVINSWYVHSEATISDQAATVISGTAGADILTGSAAKQDIFNLSLGGSKGVVGSFDTIRSFGTGDVIKLPSAINHWNVKTISGDDFVPGLALAKEATILTAFQQMDGKIFDSGADGVIKVVLGTNSYLIADSNGNGLFDSAIGNATPDLFIKIVGGVDFVTGANLVV